MTFERNLSSGNLSFGIWRTERVQVTKAIASEILKQRWDTEGCRLSQPAGVVVLDHIVLKCCQHLKIGKHNTKVKNSSFPQKNSEDLALWELKFPCDDSSVCSLCMGDAVCTPFMPLPCFAQPGPFKENNACGYKLAAANGGHFWLFLGTGLLLSGEEELCPSRAIAGWYPLACHLLL